MTNLRRLCQTLLNGAPDRAALDEAESLLRAGLAEATAAGEDPEPLCVPWEPPHRPSPEDPAQRRWVRLGLAPALLLDGVWLARAAQPATGHREPEGHLLALYCRIVGRDDPAHSPPLRFRADLVAAGLHLPDLDSPSFFHDPRLPDFALRLPALHLGLFHRPRTFFPELLGYTLAHVFRKPAWWDAAPEFNDEAGDLALAALEAYPGKQAHEARIRAGGQLYRRAFAALLAEIDGYLAAHRTAEDAMAAIVRAKGPQAVGYHGRVRLQGRTLDAWLAESAADPRPLLQALRDSPRVDRACPAGSRLIRALDFGGPMFGVFDDAERRTCLAWIDNPEAPAAREDIAGAGFSPRPPGESRSEDRSHRPLEPLSTRRLFTALLRAESPADVPPAAEAFIRRALRRTGWLGPLLPARRRRFPYSPEALHGHIETRHRREVERYRPPAGPPNLSREFCRWAALQLAPAVLVDGAWLAGIATAAEPLGEIGRHLLRIYADELGDGRAEWNHPNVYRRLLASLDVELPGFDCEEFAADPRFLDAAFDIPVYLLAMGQWSGRYFPELLGLNLAIELSGLGAGYMRVIDILRHHGIDPAIIQLHLSIDNLASGHAARARDAIVLHLDEAGKREGEAAVEALWRRIWTGYLSLDVAAFGLAIRLMARHAMGRREHRFSA